MGYLLKRAQSVIKAIRRHGILKYLKRLNHSFWQKIFKTHHSTVFSRDLNRNMELVPAKIDLEIVSWNEDRRDELFSFLGQYERFDEIQGKLDNGWLPMFGYYNQELVALSWYSFKPIYMTSVELTLTYEGPIAYIEGLRTAQQVQGKSVMTAIITNICKYLYENGAERAYICAGDDNIASQTAIRKSGFTPYERIALTKILFWRWHSRARVAHS